MTGLESARSMLFVPGDRPERFKHAIDSGADLVVLDLEDGVPDERKEFARVAIAEWVRGGGGGIVRVNPVTGNAFASDVAALRDRLTAVMLAKTESASEITMAANALGVDRILPLLENAMGVTAAREVCGSPPVVRVAIGTADLAADLSIPAGSSAGLDHARSTVVLESARAGIAPPVDGPSLVLDDVGVVAAESRHALELGFTGRLCIHPTQVLPVNSTFTPSPEEVERALRVIELSENGGAQRADGALVDAPVALSARRILQNPHAIQHKKGDQ